MSDSATPELAVPDEARTAVNNIVRAAMLSGLPVPPPGASASRRDVRAIASPVVVAELLALAAKVARTGTDLVAEEDRNGYDRAIGDIRDLIADRCDELGTKVEDL